MQRTSQQPNLLGALAEFRYQLRSFLRFSEQAAQDRGLQPRQHQLLLQIAGLPVGQMATVSFLAERLGLRQNSLVELADRSVAQGLVRRTEDTTDRRRVVLSCCRPRRGLASAGCALRQPCAGAGRVWAAADPVAGTDQGGCAPTASSAKPGRHLRPSGFPQLRRVRLKANSSALRDFTVDRRVWLLSATAVVIGIGAAPFSRWCC